MPAPLPPAEPRRLARLRSLGVLDIPGEERFDRIIELACQLTGAPMAGISLIDEHRQWFKASKGLAVCSTERDHAFCAHTILRDEPMVVPDASEDPRFAANPLVLGEPHIRFYAGAPIVVDGYSVGSLCVLDRSPHQPTTAMLRSLTDLAALTADALQRRELEARIAGAYAARSAFSGVLSHEMRTPIGAVMGYVDMMGEDLSGEERAEAVTGIGRNAEQLLKLVDDMLELVQLEAGAAVPSMTLVRPELLLRELASEFEVRAREKGIAFTTELTIAPDFLVSADPRHLRRAVASVLGNAVKFTEAHGTICLAEWAGPEEEGRRQTLWIRVTDSGIGLPPGDPEHLFRPFEVGDSSMSRRHGGAGTGLPIARHLARASGGDIRLEPAAGAGRGVTATITFRTGVPPSRHLHHSPDPLGAPAGQA
jgi:signal transduction histidine kinase